MNDQDMAPPMIDGRGSRCIPLTGFAVVCAAGGEFGHRLIEPGAPGALPSFWPPAGLLLAALIVSDRRGWWRLVTVACAVTAASMVLHGRQLLPAIELSMISGAEAWLAAWVIQRRTRGAFSLDRLPHAASLVLGAITAPMAGAILAAALLSAATPGSVLSIWRAWWLSDALGALLTAPLVIALVTARPGTFSAMRPWKAAEIAIVLGFGLVVAEIVIGGHIDPILRVPAYLLPFLLWPVFRFGLVGAAVANFALTSIALWHAARGQGLPMLLSDTNLVLRSQGGILIAGCSLFLLSSIVAERKRVAHERAELVAELQRALAEIKTLRGLIPICAWCHKIRDDAGFWQQLEQYFDSRTDATFSHSICPTCTDREQHALAAHEAAVAAD
jgi:integral membrane sensor domain MASE1